MKHRLTLIAACLAVIALTSACSSNDAPAPKPTGSASHAPTMPALAKEHTEAGAEAFVRHYIDVLNESLQSGNANPFLALSQATCENCQNIASSITDLQQAGGKLVGGQWIPHKATTWIDEENAIVTIDCELKEATVTASPSASPKPLSANRDEFHFELSFARDEQSWIVNEIATELK